MGFSLSRFEIAITSSEIDTQIPLHCKEEMIRACESSVQSKYLRYCDGSEPIHWLAKHVVYALTTEMKIKLYSQHGHSKSVEPHFAMIRERLFLDAVDLVDIPGRIRREPEAERWKWLLAVYVQYIPLTFLLNELCRRDHCEVVENAWAVVDDAFERWNDDIRTSKNGLGLLQLKEKARACRNQRAKEHWESFRMLHCEEQSDLLEHTMPDSFLDGPDHLPTRNFDDLNFLTDGNLINDTASGAYS